MAIKQFPQDFAAGAAVKLMGATSDGSMVYLVIPAGGDTLQSILNRGASATNAAQIGGLFINRAPNPSYKFIANTGVNFNLGLGIQGGVMSIEAFNDAISARIPVILTASKIDLDASTSVNGNFNATGSITPGSDKRLKKNIKNLPNALEQINSLRPVSYNHKFDNATALGFIADEVKSIFPDLVLEGSDEDKMLSMNYMGLTAPIVKAIQEMHTSQVELQTKYNDLLSRVEALEAK